MSFNFEVGQRVTAMLQSGYKVKGIYCGVAPDGTGVVNIQGFNALANPEGILPSFPLECISAMPPKDHEVVVAASLNAEEQEEQYREVLKYVVDEAITPDNLARLGYNLGFPSGEYCLSFPCPKFVMVKVKGRSTMASVPSALRNKTLMFNSYLVITVGFCHQNTEISYTWGKDGMLNLFYKWGPK
jgi:hypothetical protein